MLTVREQVLAAFFTRLQTIAGVTVERNRDAEVTVFPSLIMVDGGHQEADFSNHGIAAYRLTVDVEGFVTAATPAALGPALSDLYGKVVAALATDHTLGGIAVDLNELDSQVDIDRTKGGPPHAAFGLGYEIRYFTKPGDPYQVAP